MIHQKKGQGLSVTTIVIIILSLVVLVFLIYGFTVGWGRILPWIDTGSNVQDVVTACEIACSTNAQYDYCTRTRSIVYNNGTEASVTCFTVANDTTLNTGLDCPGMCDQN